MVCNRCRNPCQKKEPKKRKAPLGFSSPFLARELKGAEKNLKGQKQKRKRAKKKPAPKKRPKKFKGAERNPKGQTKTTTVGGNLLSR